MEDERKSTSSALTSSSFEGGSFDVTSRRDSFLFTILFPLYENPRQPRKILPMIGYCFLFLELITLSFFSINTTTKMPTMIGHALGFVNFASLGSALKTIYGVVPIALLALILILVLVLILVSPLYQWLLTHQPWILAVTKITFTVFFQILVVPIVNMSINAFDCYRLTPESSLLYRSSGATCFGSDDMLSTVGAVIAIVFLVLYFVMVAMYHFFIFRSNPKRGGYFAAPSGAFQTAIIVFVFGLIFCQRLLVDWAFWRAVVSVGTAAGFVLAVIMTQPFYSLFSNFLIVLLFTVYGTLRLCLEIGFLIDSGTGTIIGTIVMAVVGIGGGIGLSILFLHLLKMKERRTWAITISKDNEVLPKFDMGSEEGIEKLMQHVGKVSVERSVRFVLVKKLRTRALMEYADGIYSTAILRHKDDKILLANYALFLQSVTKNRIKAQVILRQCKKARPGLATRFLIHCVMKGESAENGSGGGEAMEMNLKAQLEQAENDREDARDAQIEFYDNLSKQKPNFSLLQKQLTLIVKAEAESKKSYEQLLAQNPNNVAVLRSYGVMLQKIIRDDDMADYVLAKADQIEEDTTEDYGGTMTGTIKTDPRGDTGSRVSVRKKKKKKKTQAETGIDDILGTSKAKGMTLINTVFGSISAGHIIGVIGFVAAYIVTNIVSGQFIEAMGHIRDVGTIVISGCRISIIGLQFLIHEFLWDWTKIADTDQTIDTVVELQPYFSYYGGSLTKLMKQVYESNVENDVWELVDIPVAAAFFNGTTNTTYDVTVTEKSFLNLMADMAQLATQVGVMTDLPTQFPSLHARMVSIQYNSYHPLFEAGKRALIAYADNASSASSRMRTLFNMIVGFPTAIVLISLVCSYGFISLQVTKDRKEILRRSLEVKKSSFQSVARLLTEDGSDNVTNQLNEEEEEMEQEVEEEEEEEEEEEDQDLAADKSELLENEQDETTFEKVEASPRQDEINASSSDRKNTNTDRSSEGLEPKTLDEANEPHTEDADPLPIALLPRRKLGGSKMESSQFASDVYASHTQSMHQLFSPGNHTQVLYDPNTSPQMTPPMNVGMSQLSHNLHANATVETKHDFGFGLFTERSLLTQRDEDDDHVTKRDDAEWEEAFENSVEDLHNMHKTIHSGIPVHTKVMMVMHVVAVLAVLCGYMLPNYISFFTFTSSVDNILLAAIRPICLTNSNFFLLSMAFDMPFLKFPKLITHPTCTNPVWNDSSHLGQTKAKTMELLTGSLDYFRKTSLITHFGKTAETITDDKLIDERLVTRYENEFNVRELLHQDDCFMSDRTACEEEDIHARLFETHDTVSGLQALISRFLQYGEFLKEEDESIFNETHPIFRFMNSALRNDLRDCTVNMVGRMCSDVIAMKDVFMTQLLIAVVIMSVIYLLVQFFMMTPFITFKRMGMEDRRLNELISFDIDDSNYVRFVDAMKTKNKTIDGLREKVIDSANNVIRMHNQHESAGMQEAAMEELMKMTKRSFREEEKSMHARIDDLQRQSKSETQDSKPKAAKETSITNEQLDQHKLEHRVILQRLGVIFDGLRGKDLARQAISVRQLTRLFDRHFISSDDRDLST
ncbi:hypothetical protein BLNAU_13831 [Blattamonas nauphoetae]|uniref:TmcB/TmcC TPR repeats domain-containing protein n=1 Tax=Blattamonas nauphoetae TaxID=2049346 RepID=A0ABQ9XIE0_9EUKA|nr:hypothetical protein BLNAU_13831 [Blattamonas nauphoetae]